MWLIARYQPCCLFSSKRVDATSTGGKTLLLPSPFNLRMALLDAGLRTRGVAAGPVLFELIRTLRFAVKPPARAVVTNLFCKVAKPPRRDSRRRGEEDEDEDVPQGMQSSIAFREYVYLEGELGLGISGEEATLWEIRDLLIQINYFGKRGSFFQLMDPPHFVDELPPGFVPLDGVVVGGTGGLPRTFVLGVIQLMDDWGPTLTYEKVNVYTRQQVALGPGRDRERKTVVLPYRVTRSSRGFTVYELVSPQ